MNVSVLVPRSVLYPSMGFDIVDGLRAGIQFEGASAPHFDIHNIGIAAKEQEIFSRCEQALMNGADIVVAYMNPTTVEFVHGLFEANDKILLVLDSGMHFPHPKLFSNAFFISLQGIICCNLIAKQAVESGFEKSAFTCSFYDAGYRSPLAFSNSLQAAGGGIQFNHITQLKRSDFSLQALDEFVNNNSDSSILAAFCGDMTEDFFSHGAKTDLFQKSVVFSSPYTVEEVWLDKIAYPGGKVTACATWARQLKNKENDAFKAALPKTGKANIFSVIAWEAGMLIAKAMNKPQTTIQELWSSIKFASPRGSVQMDQATHYMQAPIYLCEVTPTENGMCQLEVINELPDLEDEFENFRKETERFATEDNNSWHNAYPCLES